MAALRTTLVVAVAALLSIPTVSMLVAYGTVSPCEAFKREARAAVLAGMRPGDLTIGSTAETAGRGLGMAVGATMVGTLIDAQIAKMSTLDCARALVRLKTNDPTPLAASAPAPPPAVRDPTGFRDFPWGTPEAALRQHFDRWMLDCYPSGGQPLGTQGCRVGFEIGDIKPDDAAFYLRDGKLVGWLARLPRHSRDTIITALTERYGGPTVQASDAIAWYGRTARASLFLDDRGDTLIVATIAEIDRATQDREAAQRRATEKTTKGF